MPLGGDYLGSVVWRHGLSRTRDPAKLRQDVQHKEEQMQGRIQDLEKGGSTVMYEAPEERNEARSASGWVDAGGWYPPSHQFDVFFRQNT